MNSEFCVAVHALVFLSHKQASLSSETLAKNICTHPARVRRVMAKLKRAGLVHTKEGVDGGYQFPHPPGRGNASAGGRGAGPFLYLLHLAQRRHGYGLPDRFGDGCGHGRAFRPDGRPVPGVSARDYHRRRLPTDPGRGPRERMAGLRQLSPVQPGQDAEGRARAFPHKGKRGAGGGSPPPRAAGRPL